MRKPSSVGGNMNRVLTAGMLLLWAVWSAPTPAFGQNTDTWTNGTGSARWSDAGNWSNGVPVASSDVIITNVHPVNQDVNATVNTVTINPGGEIAGISFSLDLNGTSFTNNGQLLLTGFSTLGGSGPSLTLSGSGTVTMSNDGLSAIVGNALENKSPSIIQGAGTIGGYSATLNNSGTMNANSQTNPLNIQPGSGGITNTGILEASGGGTLVLDGFKGGVQNAGGLIYGNGGTVLLTSGVTIVSGQLATSSGVISTNKKLGSATLDGVTLLPSCVYQINSGGSTSLKGAITNNGTIKVNDTTLSGAFLDVQDATLTGSGIVTTSDSSHNYINGGTLINQLTIEGVGTINVGKVINQNTIMNFPSTNPLIIQPGSSGVDNTGGTIKTSGGTITLMGGMVTSTGGTISSDSIVNFINGVTVAGGTIASNVGGVHHLQMATLDGMTSPVTVAGLVEVLNGDIATLTGSFGFSGAANLFIDNSDCKGCSNSTIDIKGNVTLNPSGPFAPAGPAGTITMSSNPNNVIQGVTGTEVLTNNITIQGAGNIGNGRMGLVNGATGQIIASSSSVPLVIAMGPSNVFKNQGLLSVAANAGSAPSVLTITGKFANFSPTTSTLTGGKLLINGTLQFDNANIVTNAANLTLAGQIVNQANVNALANFANNAATGSLTVLPQTFGTNFTSAGPFSNAGKVTITKGVAFVVGGSGTNYNQTGGSTTVDGRLAVPLGGLVNITGGTLQGGGSLPLGSTITGSVSLGNASGAAGTFIIGDSVKKSGLIAITNNYAQLATGAMDMQIGGATPGTQYSQLNITGTSALSGTLNIAVINKFKPTIGQTFTVLNASTGITGTFSVVNGTAIDSTKHFSISYNPTTVVLTVVSGPAPKEQSLLAVR